MSAVTTVKAASGDAASYLIGLDDKPGAALIAASVRDVPVRVNNVCAITGLSVPTIYRLMGRNRFPRPLKITSTARAWKLSEVTACRERENIPQRSDAPDEPGPNPTSTPIKQNCDER
jgi:predicted DNA-binding transcriptional regulator AlpA